MNNGTSLNVNLPSQPRAHADFESTNENFPQFQCRRLRASGRPLFLCSTRGAAKIYVSLPNPWRRETFLLATRGEEKLFSSHRVEKRK